MEPGRSHRSEDFAAKPHGRSLLLNSELVRCRSGTLPRTALARRRHSRSLSSPMAGSRSSTRMWTHTHRRRGRPSPSALRATMDLTASRWRTTITIGLARARRLASPHPAPRLARTTAVRTIWPGRRCRAPAGIWSGRSACRELTASTSTRAAAPRSVSTSASTRSVSAATVCPGSSRVD